MFPDLVLLTEIAIYVFKFSKDRLCLHSYERVSVDVI